VCVCVVCMREREKDVENQAKAGNTPTHTHTHTIHQFPKQIILVHRPSQTITRADTSLALMTAIENDS